MVIRLTSPINPAKTPGTILLLNAARFNLMIISDIDAKTKQVAVIFFIGSQAGMTLLRKEILKIQPARSRSASANVKIIAIHKVICIEDANLGEYPARSEEYVLSI